MQYRPILICGHTWAILHDMKTEVIKVRLTDLEKRAFQESAGLAGLPLSGWVRERLRRAARIELEDAGKEIPFFHGNLEDERAMRR
jgi:hypothetical protein